MEAGLSEPAALALSDEGVLYIADQSNNRVRAVDLATGVIRTVAGTGTAGYNGDGCGCDGNRSGRSQRIGACVRWHAVHCR